MVPNIKRKGVQETMKKAGHELFKQATNEYATFLCDQAMALFGNVYSLALHADTFSSLFLPFFFLSFLCFIVTYHV